MLHTPDISCVSDTFVSQALSLFVWSTSGVEQQAQHEDANRGQLIYEQQTTMELLEYGYMLHRALLSRVESTSNSSEVYNLRWSQNKLLRDLSDATHFGETRELLHAGWASMKLSQIQERISEGLLIRSEQASIRESRRNEKLGRSLAIIFGLIAVPPIATDVLSPIWSIYDWWVPTSEPVKKLFFISIAVTVIISIVKLVTIIGGKSQQS